MKFRTEVSIIKDGFNLNVADNIVLLGSCFTKNIGTKLVDYKFNCDVNAFGVLYNPMSICRSLDSLLSGEDFPYEKYLFQNGEIWNSWLHSGDFSAPDVVFMDPPRAGSDRKFLDSLIKMSPKKVVYVSCNPETLARDLAYLTQNSPYKAQKIQPVDMFPHTAHIETVVLMSRK